MKKIIKIKWSKKAQKSLGHIYNYIKKDSPKAALKVRTRLLERSKSLLFFPEKFSKENLLEDSGRNYRSVSVWRYKILYEIRQDTIIIVNIFDGAQDPEKIKHL